MKVVFLGGGIGKRMFPITEDKFLLNFVGKTLLEHHVAIATKAGFDRFVIICNPANMEQIKSLTGNIPGAKFELALQKQALGIASALKSAEHLLDEEIVVVNPNDVFPVSAYTRLLQESRKNTATSYMLGYQVKDYFPGGYLVVDSSNELKNIVEKPKPGEEPSQLVNMLVHIHTNPKKVLEYADRVQTTKDDVYECALDSLAREGHKIKVVPYTDFWAPIKYPWHIFDAVEYFLHTSTPQVSPSASISEKATIEGKVIIDDGVRILENAVIRGPVYIGQYSVIGNNALVRNYSHIGRDCVVGYSTEVKASYIGNGCWFHSNYIGDSIMGNNCSFGSGTVLANFRFDEGNISVNVGDEVINTGKDKLGAIIGDNCRTGINASIMPGTKIGPNSIVGAHVCLMNDLEANKMILSEPRYRKLPNETEPDERNRKELKKRITKAE